LDPVEGISRIRELAGLGDVFRKHSVLLAYLFGSRARGIYSADSDYDIAVLFEGECVGILKEVELTLDVARKLGVPSSMVNIVSLNSFDYPIVARVLREGVPIYQKSAEHRKAWERKACLQILQNTDLYAVYTKRILKQEGKRRRI
jgi:predicted nucleotidyltransferase